MNLEWIVTGVILFGGMTAAAIGLWIKRRGESQTVLNSSFFETKAQPDLTDLDKNNKNN